METSFAFAAAWYELSPLPSAPLFTPFCVMNDCSTAADVICGNPKSRISSSSSYTTTKFCFSAFSVTLPK